MSDKLTPDQKKHLSSVLLQSLPEQHRAKALASCSCDGCSCPPGSGDICDGGTYVGYAGGYYGAASA